MLFSVATFNVGGQYRLGWAERRLLSMRLLEELNPDVIGFQEYGVTTHADYWPIMPHLDVVMVRGLQVESCEIVKRAWPPRYASDHWSVRAVVDYI